MTQRWIPDAFAGPMAGLLAWIATGEAPTAARDNLRTLALVHALYASIESGYAGAGAVMTPPASCGQRARRDAGGAGSTVKGHTREIWPLLLAEVAVLLTIIYVPTFMLTLPELVFG